MMAPTTASDVANYIICYFQKKGEEITHLKLQKLLYYAQGWYLALLDEPLFDDELQAWVHGAVEPNLYQKFKKYRWDSITEEVICPKFEGTDIKRFLNKLLQVYGHLTPRQLEIKIHHESPWLNAREGLGDFEAGNRNISHQDMKDHFRKLGKESKNGRKKKQTV